MNNRPIGTCLLLMFFLILAVSFKLFEISSAIAGTTTFSTAGSYSYTVPTGITKIQVQVAGGGGGGGGYDTSTAGNGGTGALVSITLSVTPGQVISGTIGSGGRTGWTSGASTYSPACSGGGALGSGFGNGGVGGNANCPSNSGYSGGGGGGGGSTNLLLAGTNIVQAGGGGGGGGSTNGGVGGAGGQGNTVTIAATCASVQNGGTGGSFTGDGGGGGGGGGGYTRGAGGAAAADGGSPGGGGAGRSCYSSNAAVLSGAVTIGGGAGANGQTVASNSSNGIGTSGWVIIVAQPTVTITKVSNGGTSSFTFTGTNGWSSQTISTVASGAGVAGTTQGMTTVSTATTITEAIPVGYTMTAVSCSGLGSGGTATPNLSAGSIAFNAAAIAWGADITCTVTNTKMPTLTLTKTSLGAVGGFTFTGTNGWSSQTITTATSGTSVTGSTQILAAASAATTITEAIPAGYVLTAASCAGLGSGGTATPNLSAGTIAFSSAATSAGANITCAITNTKTPTLKLQVTTLGGASTPSSFTFSQTNLMSTPANVTTTAASTPTPASPFAINIASIGTAVSLTQSSDLSFFLSGATCTDANSGITGNTGSIGTVAGTSLTLPSANIVAGAEFTCVFSNTKSVPQLEILKTASTSSAVNVGQTITYTYTIKNIGNVTISNAYVTDAHFGYGVSPTPYNELLTTDVMPIGDSTDSAIDGNWDVLAPGDSVTFSSVYSVVQADIDFLQ